MSDIECDGCAASIEKALRSIGGVEAVEVDILNKTVIVAHDPPLASVESVAVRLDHLGFPATVVVPIG